MTVAATAGEIGLALGRMQTMLGADGYELDVRVERGQVNLTVRETPNACEECLVPKELLASMVVSMLQEGGISIGATDVALRYPADS